MRGVGWNHHKRGKEIGVITNRDRARVTKNALNDSEVSGYKKEDDGTSHIDILSLNGKEPQQQQQRSHKPYSFNSHESES